ncbi:DUF4124 domain-containing protein [Methylophaga sp. OBS3]|uniref:DUF4124 domain-containing protein n=1 Tax=Methylophaga sp. OBS3 TaxID=2991934 RepID=UPI00225AC1AF|nr:DUF4124 domain-containing protein [Methylophaga sp. OBS3]MCX4190488.1 DUF4124 domain-containing protein [Methylophaga sp. OBS3]
MSLCLTSNTVFAGQLYRFNDESGTPTLSKTLPPEAAQQGYDILDDKSMRLIERVPPALNEAELAEEAKRQVELEAQQKAAAVEAQQAANLRRQQQIHDQQLLSIYSSETELVADRDQELGVRQARLDALVAKQPKLEQRLVEAQEEAAKRELSGAAISNNLKKRLAAAEQELTINRQMINELSAEISALTEQYESDRQRLNKLLTPPR